MGEDVKVGKTICFFCPPGCGIDVHVKDNKPIKVESMMESIVGPICIKAEVLPEWYETELKNRLLHPLKKVKFGWKRISWDEAFDIMIDKFNEIKEKYGPQALACYIGQVESFRDFGYAARRFFIGFGSDSYYSVDSTCYFAKVIAANVTYGAYAPPTLIGTKLITVWAANPTESVPFAADTMMLMKQQQGVKLVVIDPRRTLLAKAADMHLQIRPGTDGALALAVLNVMIEEDLYDKDFVEKYTIGFDKLAQHVKNYTPEKVQDITWIPADMIREYARLYATTKPATIFQGNCLDTVENGFQACRAICCMIALSGNLDARGGSTMMPFYIFSKVALETVPEDERPKVKGAGAETWPLFYKYVGQPPMEGLIRAILEEKPYPIKALIVQAGNPVLSWVDSNRQKRAYEKLEFMVVHDLFMTETAELADLVLPACTTYEQQQIYQYVGRPLFALMNKVIEPPEECMPDWKLWWELAHRMGFGEKYLPWKDVDEMQNQILKDCNLRIPMTVEDLKANPGGVFHRKREWKKYEREGFDTPSGKCELYSEQLKEVGLDPLPTYTEPSESPLSSPQLFKKFPLILITGKRSLYFMHSMHRNTPTLRAKEPEPMVEINTETARKLGISSGDMVIVETQRGAVLMRAAVTADIHPMVVSVPHDWGGLANQNLLTGGNYDPAWGGMPTRGLLCRVRKADPAQAPEIILEE